jgi:hypothetical protein
MGSVVKYYSMLPKDKLQTESVVYANDTFSNAKSTSAV